MCRRGGISDSECRPTGRSRIERSRVGHRRAYPTSTRRPSPRTSRSRHWNDDPRRGRRTAGRAGDRHRRLHQRPPTGWSSRSSRHWTPSIEPIWSSSSSTSANRSTRSRETGHQPRNPLRAQRGADRDRPQRDCGRRPRSRPNGLPAISRAPSATVLLWETSVSISNRSVE